MYGRLDPAHHRDVAPLAGSVDRNDGSGTMPLAAEMSLPSRGAWIEIATATARWAATAVAPLAGSVDRNVLNERTANRTFSVAPLAGSVDRNRTPVFTRYGCPVAPLAGSVDRNSFMAKQRSEEECRSPRGERG